MNEAEKLLYKYYEEDNFEVIDIKPRKKHKTKLCYVFFSSNGLYKDRNDVEIIKKMHETGRYEWKYISTNKRIRQKAARIIFLRDVFKIFYIRGISSKNNAIDKIAHLLMELTSGMDVVLAGSSAGAYMSLLIGNILPNTKRIIALGGIAELKPWRTFSSYLDDNFDKCNYIDITNYLNGNYWIVNFYGKNNNYDKHNAKIIDLYANKDKLINVGFDTDIHAPRPSGDDIIKLLVCSNEHLMKLQKRVNKKDISSQACFSKNNIGIIKSSLNNLKSHLVKTFKISYDKKN